MHEFVEHHLQGTIKEGRFVIVCSKIPNGCNLYHFILLNHFLS